VTAADVEEEARVRLLVGDERNRERLHRWVTERSGMSPAPSGAFPDLYVADPEGLRESAAEVGHSQRTVDPEWIPLLLVVPADREATVEDLERFEAEHGFHIDATVSAPLREAALTREVETLLRSRRLAGDLAEREARLRLYRRAMDDIQQGITIADARADDYPVIYVNDAFERITGYACEEVLGRNCRFLQGPGTAEESLDEIRAALETETSVTVELLNYRRDGTPFWNQLHLAPIRDGSGAVTHYIGLQRDVTERKRRFQRLSVLDRVLRHNIRNKTNVIAGYAADVESGQATDPVRAGAAIRRAANDLLSLSEAAREFHDAMEATDERRVRDLAELSAEAVATTRAELATDAEMRVEGSGVEAPVTPAVELALEELLANAVEHSDRDRPKVTVTVSEADQWAEVAIADDGPGIPEGVLSVIDSPAETATEHLDRLGLWLVSWAVRSAGGELAFEANEPRGSVVRVRLPKQPGA